MKIVYAGADYVPPHGVIVRPLHEHPAIAEDMQRSSTTSWTWHKTTPYEERDLGLERALMIRDHLLEFGRLSARMIAKHMDITQQSVHYAMSNNKGLFKEFKCGRYVFYEAKEGD